jgi:hypothetical protein
MGDARGAHRQEQQDRSRAREFGRYPVMVRLAENDALPPFCPQRRQDKIPGDATFMSPRIESREIRGDRWRTLSISAHHPGLSG